MTVRSRRLWLPSATVDPGSSALLFTCPTDRTAIVRTIIAVVASSSAAATNVRLFINAGGGDLNLYFYGPIGVGRSGVLSSVVILNPGDEIRANHEPAGVACRVGGYGTLLVGAPS